MINKRQVNDSVDWREMHWRVGDIHIHLRAMFVEVSWIQALEGVEDSGVTMTVMDDNFDSVEFVLKANGARPVVLQHFRAIRLVWDSWTNMKVGPQEQELF